MHASSALTSRMKKAERFDFLMKATEKKLQLEEKRTMIEEKMVMLKENKVEITSASEEAKMLTLKVAELDDDARMLMQVVRFKML